MPLQSSNRITDRVQGSGGQAPTQTAVEARQVDFLSGSTPRPSGDLDGLLNGLGTFNASLKDYAAQRADELTQEGKHARARGETLDDKRGATFVNGYMALDGYLKGEQDKAELAQKYATDFDKDGGDVEKFIADFAAEKTKGVPQGSWTDGYNETFTPALLDIRKQHKEYITKKVVATSESNSVELLVGGIGAYIKAGQPVPDEYRDRIKGYLGENLGVSARRFDDLEFAAVKRLGDEGNFSVYDMFKRPRSDGAPGLYFDPAWKEKIDQAQLHATNVFLSKQGAAEKAAKAAREDAQDVAMLEVFQTDDPKEATRMFEGFKSRGLFTRASELVKYEKLLVEKVDGKPSIDQLDNEMALLPSALSGGLSLKTILSADITRGQKMGLITKNKEAINEARRLAVSNQANQNKIFNDPLYRAGETYLETYLKPRPASPTDFMGVGTPFDRGILARGRIEFVNAMKGRRPDEAASVAMEITDRHLKQRNTFSPSQQANVAVGKVPFNNIGEAIQAARSGAIAPSELDAYTNYFAAQGK